MRVRAYQQNDRLYFQSSDGSPALHLEIADGIRVERTPHGRLLLTNDKNAWVGVLTLAVRLGWCRVGDQGSEPEADGVAAGDP